MLDRQSSDDKTLNPSASSPEAGQVEPQRSLLGEAVHQVVGLAWSGDSKARSTTENVITQVAGNVSYFVGGGFGYAGSALFSALNSAKVGESGPELWGDLALGSVKGLGTRGAFQYFGGKDMNFAMKGMAMGVSQRTLDVGLNRQSYLDGDGKFTIGAGLALAASEAASPQALLVDVATFGVMSRSPWRNVGLTGLAAGVTSGAIGEVQNQLNHNENLDIGKILGSAAEQGLVMSTSALIGHKLTPASSAPVIRPMETRIESAPPASKTLADRLDGLKSMLGFNDGLVPATAVAGSGAVFDRAQILKMTAADESAQPASSGSTHSEGNGVHDTFNFDKYEREEAARKAAEIAWRDSHTEQLQAAHKWVAELNEHKYEHRYLSDRYAGQQGLPLDEAQHIVSFVRGEPDAMETFHKANTWTMPDAVRASADVVESWARNYDHGELRPEIYQELLNSPLQKARVWYHGAVISSAESKVDSIDFEHVRLLQALYEHEPHNLDNFLSGVSHSSTRAGVEAASVIEWLKTHRDQTLTEEDFNRLPFQQISSLSHLIDSLNSERGPGRKRPQGEYPLTEKEMDLARFATTVDKSSERRLLSYLGPKADELVNAFGNRGIEASRFATYLTHWSLDNPNARPTTEVLDSFMKDPVLKDGKFADALKRKDPEVMKRPAGDLAVTQEEMETLSRLAQHRRHFNYEWEEQMKERGYEAWWLVRQANRYFHERDGAALPAEELQRLGTSDTARSLRMYDDIRTGRNNAYDLPAGDSPITLQEAKDVQLLQEVEGVGRSSQMAFYRRSVGAMKMAEEVVRVKEPLTQELLDQMANTPEMKSWRLVDALQKGIGSARQIPEGRFPVTSAEASNLDFVIGPQHVSSAFKSRSPEAARFVDFLYDSRDPRWGWHREEMGNIDPARYLRIGIAAHQFELNAPDFETPKHPNGRERSSDEGKGFSDFRSLVEESQNIPNERLESYFGTWSKLIASRPDVADGNWVNPRLVRRITEMLPADANLSGNQLRGLYDRLSAMHDLFIKAETEYRQHSLTLDNMSPEQISTASRAWANEPRLPDDLALEVGSQGLRQWLGGAIAWRRALKQLGVDSQAELSDAQSIELRTAFRDQMTQLDSLRSRDLLRLLPSEGNIPDAVELHFENSLSAADRTQLSKALLKNTLMPIAGEENSTAITPMTIRDPYNVIATVSPKSFADALRATEKHGGADPGAALAGSLVFRGSFDQWLNMQSNFERKLHDATYWIPIRPGEANAGLGPTLIKNGKARLVDLELLSREWPNLDAATRKRIDDGKLDEVLQDFRSRTYPGFKNKAFAAESATWGVKPEDYAKFEERYLESQKVAVPFSLEARWKSGNLTGRFLPRSDARGLFMGQYTNCCQHPYGQAASSAWHGQESPDAAFFVIEDARGEIVAGSWVYKSAKGGVVVDNVEAKGLGKRISAVQDIVQNMADSLSKEFGRITLGTKYTDVDTNKWPDTAPLPLPDGYKGYTDAGVQVLLADTYM